MQGNGGDDSIVGSDEFGEVFAFGNGDGNDTIANFGDNDTLQITAGTIEGSTVIGNDVVFGIVGKNSSGTVTLQDVADKEFKINGSTAVVSSVKTVTNRADNVKVKGSSVDEEIFNSGANVTINGGAGNDTITGSSYGEVYQFGATDGQDVVTNFGKEDTLQITSGTIQSSLVSGDDVIFNVKNGKKTGTITLQNAASYHFVQNGNELTVNQANYIDNADDDKKIVGTSKADWIVNSGKGVSIASGKGNDTIEGSNFGDVYMFAYNNGANIITNFGNNDTIVATSGTMSYEKNGEDLLVSITKKTTTSTVLLRGAGNLKLKQDGNALVVDQTNYIDNADDDVKVSGTSKEDYITATGDNVTIAPGKGNDTITGSDKFGDLYQFAYTNGDNVITNFGKADTLQSTSGTLTYAVDGNDVLVSIAKKTTTSTVRLQDAAKLRFIQNGNELTVDQTNFVENDKDGVKVSGTGKADWLINTGENVTLAPGKGNDTLTGSDEYGDVFAFAYTNGENIITNFGKKDTLKSTSGTISYEKSGDDYVVSIKKSSTTSTITLQGAGELVLKKNGSLLTAEQFTRIENDYDGVRVVGTDEDDVIINTGANATIQPNGGNDTINGSDEFGELYVFGYTDGDNLITNFGKNDSIQMSAGKTMTYETIGNDVVVSLTKSKTTATVTLAGAAEYTFKKNGSLLSAEQYKEITNRKDNKKVNGSAFDDYITNTGANATINGKGGNDTIETSGLYGEVIQFAADGGQDYVTGFGKDDTLQITSGEIQSTLANGDDVIINVKSSKYSGAITLGGAAKYKLNRNGKFITVEQANYIVNAEDGKKVNGTSKADWIVNSGENVTIAPGKGNDTIEGSNFGDVFAFAYNNGANVITNFDANDTIAATSGEIGYEKVDGNAIVSIKKGKTASTITLQGAGELQFKKDGNALVVDQTNYIDNADDDVKVSGTSKEDYITNTGENVTVQPGKGNDTITGSDKFGETYLFAYTNGENVITNFGDNDTLRATSGTLSYTIDGNDAIVSITKGKTKSTVTLQDAAEYKFIQNGNVLTVEHVEEKINSEDNIKFSGTSDDDYLINNGQNVSIASGKGNDTIEGSSFGETFLFAQTDGNNVITNFGIGDTLQATGGNLTYKVDGDDAIVSITKSKKTATVTLQGAGNQAFIQDGRNLYIDVPFNVIENSNDKTKVNGTSNADYIVNTGEFVTINGSKGNDTITGSDTYGELYLFAYTHGNNVITNFGIGDTLKSTTGTLSYAKSDNDYIVSITKSGKTSKITLEGAAEVGTVQFNTKKTAMILRSAISLELPSEDYWFEQDSATDELGELLGDSAIDNEIGMLEPSSAISIGGAQKDEFIAAISRKKSDR